jgi:sterol desaturase/sphingolipid hydroxylase (fatty acid hydroxylase superfamily)
MIEQDICNKRITPRLFSNDLLEKLSHVHPATPLAIYVPVIGYCLYHAVLMTSSGFALIAALILAGLICWTFVEYTLHRFVFHYQPSSAIGERIHFLFHGIHHEYPRDPLRLVMPPSVSLPLAGAFYLLFRSLLGGVWSMPFFAGFMAGYLCYDSLHYAVHHYSFKGNRLFAWIKRHHLRHHYLNDRTGYGVSSPLWDYIFGTMPAYPAKPG